METIHRLYEHLHWANQRLLETLQQTDPLDQRPVKLFAHLLHAEQVWMTRLKGEDSKHLPVWSEADSGTCAAMVAQNDQVVRSYIHQLTHADLDELVTYRNQKGQQYETSVRDILTHLALHGQYHRGQINAQLRAGGHEPVNVDFITFVRIRSDQC